MKALPEYLHDNYVYPYTTSFTDEEYEMYSARRKGEYPKDEFLLHFSRKYYEKVTNGIENKNTGDIFLTDPQSEFIKNPFDEKAFVAGFSAGKTETLIIIALKALFAYKDPNIVIGIFAPTLDLIKVTSLPRILMFLEYLGYKDCLNKSDMIITTPYGSIMFRSMLDPDRIVGFEVMISLID